MHMSTKKLKSWGSFVPGITRSLFSSQGHPSSKHHLRIFVHRRHYIGTIFYSGFIQNLLSPEFCQEIGMGINADIAAAEPLHA